VLKWGVPRRREKSPYQLPFEFGRHRVEDTTVYRALLHRLAAESRFVRVVRDEIVVRSPADAAVHLLKEVFVPFERLDQEELWVLLLSTRNRITHEVMLYRGTVDTVLVRPAEVFKEAVRVNAAAVLLAHNHPSGESSPSPQDVQLTELVNQAGELLGIHT
jgi:DNA repair protein RadC